MARRYTGNMNGEKYLGNSHTKQVHDLDKENALCRIDDIIKAGHDKPLNSLQMARSLGYYSCNWCFGGTKR